MNTHIPPEHIAPYGMNGVLCRSYPDMQLGMKEKSFSRSHNCPGGIPLGKDIRFFDC